MLPIACVIGFDSAAWRRLFLEFQLNNYAEISCVVPALLTMIGAWMGAFTLPLDWERWWQEWPLPCMFGAIGGYVAGIIMSIMYAYRPKWTQR